jgi:heterodisulfide reductase subunit C
LTVFIITSNAERKGDKLTDQANCIALNSDNLKFSSEIKERSGVDIGMCWQCLTCTNGCPVAHAMDFKPNVLVELVRLGFKKEVLESSTIWLCVGCNTCATRCPNLIDLAALNDTLRKIAIEEKVKISQPGILKFHQEVLRSIRSYGRTHKLEIMLRYKLYRRDWFSDAVVGTKMMLKQKLSLIPHRIKKLSEIRNIFKVKRLS